MFAWIFLLAVAPAVLLVLSLFLSKGVTRTSRLRTLEDLEQLAALRAARRQVPRRGVFATHDGH